MANDTPRRSLVPAAALTLVIALTGLLIYGMVTGGTNTTLDDAVKRGQRPTAPGQTIELDNLNDNGTTKLTDLKGKIVVLNFWAHWCEPCRDEVPELIAVQKRLQSQGLGTVLGATYDDPPADARKFAKQYRINYPIASDIGTKLAREFGTKSLPETFVIDRNGRVVAIARGQTDRKFLNQAIATALQ